ncbi:MAG: c-type cytochrome [Planctomycetota bacterium]|jgi:cytochrome c551/c552|nr:c-type cytochrome [Planctomycetota bacterium]
MKDPITDRSLSWPLAIASALLLLSTAWVLYDEIWGARPWKGYQKTFRKVFVERLENFKQQQVAKEQDIRQEKSFLEMEEARKAAMEDAKKSLAEVQVQMDLINRKNAALTPAMQDARGRLGEFTYQLEKARKGKKEGEAKALEAKIEKIKAKKYKVAMPALEKGKTETVEMVFDEIAAEFSSLKNLRGDLQRQQAALNGPAREIQSKMASYLQARIHGLQPHQIDARITELKEKFRVGIQDYQIHVEDVGLVDRCQVCHLGAMEKVATTQKDLFDAGLKTSKEVWGDPSTYSKEKSALRRALVSHPRPDLLKVHDPEKFGCSPCHGGNGIATTSVVRGHGWHKYWLYPLFEMENAEAGCQQCHTGSLHLEGATTLNVGKEIFSERGCWGCHRMEGFDQEVDDLKLIATRQGVLTRERKELLKSQAFDEGMLDDEDDLYTDEQLDEAQKRLDQVYPYKLSEMETEEIELAKRRSSLHAQRKRVGPNLKDLRAKVKPGWLAHWIDSPHVFRPGTKMPSFRLDPDQVQSISAFLWEHAIDPERAGYLAALQKEAGKHLNQKAADAVRGKNLFETRGCMACHSMGEGDSSQGSDFAANLSRVGEKIQFPFLMRWIQNPRKRLVPSVPESKGRDRFHRDLYPDGDPYDAETDGVLLTTNATVMPQFRLPWDEVRDIAGYLMTQRGGGGSFEEVPPWLKAEGEAKEKLLADGQKWVSHFGCAGCHEIGGFETEGRIGTELTKEGSKPLDRLDFGLFTHQAKKLAFSTHDWIEPIHKDEGNWYTHKGFFVRKLGWVEQDEEGEDKLVYGPDFFDQGKERSREEKLRMPNFRLSKNENTAVTTFLLGSVDSQFPPRFYHNPEGRAKAIEEGWWIIKKYNCQGCHAVGVSDKPSLGELPWFDGRSAERTAPPTLVGEGSRVYSDWLSGFLRDPSMATGAHENRNGIRPYLAVRMPSFHFSEEEVGKLVRFFEAMSSQPTPYIKKENVPLSRKELALMRKAFTDKEGPCQKCHVGDGMIAPNFVHTPARLKPSWIRRWLLDPSQLSPGTSMPSGLFGTQAPWKYPPLMGYGGDHVDLFVRYLRQYDEGEAKALEKME